MTVSTDLVKFDIAYEGVKAFESGSAHTWIGTWKYPDGESEEEWLDALAERCITDRIVEDSYDSLRHVFSLDASDGQITVTATVNLDDGEAMSEEELQEEGADLVGIVQGLIYSDGYVTGRDD